MCGIEFQRINVGVLQSFKVYVKSKSSHRSAYNSMFRYFGYVSLTTHWRTWTVFETSQCTRNKGQNFVCVSKESNLFLQITCRVQLRHF